MSASYTLEISTSSSIEQVTSQLFRSVIHTRNLPDADGAILIETSSFLAKVRKTEDLREAYSFPLGIQPTIDADFSSLAYDQEHPYGFESLLKVTVDWLSQTDDDAALIYDGVYILLMRKSGALIVNSDARVWTAEGLKLITLPHTIEYLLL